MLNYLEQQSWWISNFLLVSLSPSLSFFVPQQLFSAFYSFLMSFPLSRLEKLLNALCVYGLYINYTRQQHPRRTWRNLKGSPFLFLWNLDGQNVNGCDIGAWTWCDECVDSREILGSKKLNWRIFFFGTTILMLQICALNSKLIYFKWMLKKQADEENLCNKFAS